MKKFIAVFNELRLSESTKDYIIYIAKHCNSHLIGIFLDSFTHHTYSFTDITAMGSNWEEKIEDINKEEKNERFGSKFI